MGFTQHRAERAGLVHLHIQTRNQKENIAVRDLELLQRVTGQGNRETGFGRCTQFREKAPDVKLFSGKQVSVTRRLNQAGKSHQRKVRDQDDANTQRTASHQRLQRRVHAIGLIQLERR